ncbi:unnamed protein product [Dovyalis caffra]|uniref:Uncharacterized protein n=1 Tax=Dovyalis caffra TaxID=77055 RepID=A0AAV1RJT2_9ROSI|nr:unnamed protein product [Dovyalis caffra]
MDSGGVAEGKLDRGGATEFEAKDLLLDMLKQVMTIEDEERLHLEKLQERVCDVLICKSKYKELQLHMKKEHDITYNSITTFDHHKIEQIKR